MANQTIIDAIRQRRCLDLVYDGYSRTVEVHVYGLTAENHEVMRVWQVSGGSVHNEPSGWKMLTVADARTIRLSRGASTAPRPGYNRADPAIWRIFAQV